MRSEEIHEILGISREEYHTMVDKYRQELLAILHTGSHTKTADLLLKWFSEGDETERMVKGIAVSLVFYQLMNAVTSLLPPEVSFIVGELGQTIMFVQKNRSGNV